MTDQEHRMSVLDIFTASQETFEEAKKKSIEENGKRVNYFRFTQDGTFTVRILPLAPVIDADGNMLPMERKGYEYPLRSLMLKIADEKHTDKKGNPKINYVSVCNAKQVFPTLEADLIDVYVKVACDLYADDEALCKKLREGSFNGGLKWDSRRCMYIMDCDKRGDGLQILQLSYAQYKDLEERKLNLWNKLNKNNKNVPCPISSIDKAYPLEITRKTEGGKTSYSFNIDTVSDYDVLSDDELELLLNTQRLPEVLYRYTRFHLEATIVFLQQLDDKYKIDVMSSAEVSECIEQIKLLIPADDQSHFTLGTTTETDIVKEDIDSLWDRFDKIYDSGLDDKSAEGQELRTSIKEYIEDNNLDIKITRAKSNQDLLESIEKLMSGASEDEDEQPVAEDRKPARRVLPEQDETVLQPEEDEPEDEPENEPEEDEPENGDNPEEAPEENVTHRRVRERNDDTNEPASRPSRRISRPRRR